MKILRLLKTALIAGPVIVFYHFRYMLKFCKHPEKYSLEYRYKIVRKEISILLNCLCIDYKMENMDMFEKINSKCLIIANHLSFIDPMVLIVKSEVPVTFVAKIETFSMPFVGKIAKAIDVFPLDRNNLMNQISSIKEIVNYLKDPNKPSVCIFIEGTRNKVPSNPCLEFHPGTLKFATMANVPLLTLAHYGTFRSFDKNSYLKRVPVQYKFLKVRQPEELKEVKSTELAVILKKEIDEQVDEFRKIDLEMLKGLKISKKRFELESACDARVKS